MTNHSSIAHRDHKHYITRVGWLRAAVLGANDGIISTASLIVGVASAAVAPGDILLTGIAGLVGGAMSMAAGEYVSVSSQHDTEQADLAVEREALQKNPELEKLELMEIYVNRGLDPELAKKVADQLTAHDALSAHARDELGIHEHTSARPVQAAVTSAVTFSAGAAAPLALVLLAPPNYLAPVVALGSLAFLSVLGMISAAAGGAHWKRATLRVTFWGALAMAVTAGIGKLVGAVV